MELGIKSFFLKNTGIKQTIFKNTFWLALAELFSRFLEAILVIYIVRALGAAEFGKFAFAMAFASMFIAFSSLGLSDIFTRELSYDKTAEKEYSAILSLKIILGAGAFFLAIIGSIFVTSDISIRLIITAFSIFYFFNDFFSIIYAFLRARQKMEYEAGFKIIRSLILIIAVSLVVFKKPSIQNISYGYLFANFLALILVLLYFHFKIHPLKLSFDRAVWQKFFKLSWPLGLSAVLGAILVNTDSVIMGYLNQTAQNGWYNASRKTVAIIIIPSSLVFTSFYPVLSKLFKESKTALQRVWDHYMASMIFFAFPIILGGIIAAPKLINFIYGPNFGPSILIFQILIFIAGINFIYYPYALILIASGQQKKYLWSYLTGTAANVVLNLVLIPLYGPYGAAVSAVATYVVLLLLLLVFSKYFTPISIFNIKLLKVAVAVGLSSFIMFFSIRLPDIRRLLS